MKSMTLRSHLCLGVIGLLPLPLGLGFSNLQYCVRRDIALVLTSSTEEGEKNNTFNSCQLLMQS